MLRGLTGTVAATLRTNLHRRPEGPLALKLDPAAVPDMPAPAPYREIFVQGPTVEGVHLRAGPVSRGGLRFSDRPEDYRAEVLDLLRTQVLKNALIVPTGAKGGFVLKQSGVEADRPSAIRAAYEAFITGLLDLTDDLDGDLVAPVPGRWDGDDPYLVVAADKGTAAFSDAANALSEGRGFWLGDAFASGGSVGYDHKALGITARGAWVAVSHHFRELDVEVATEEFSVVGIGDMSGDVFGNGMLLSERIRLVAAFDHRHVFLDPDPDPAVAFRERRRLFERPGSSWHDYDRDLISSGGGVHPRTRKRIELSRQVRDVLRVTDAHLTPAALIQAILRAPTDLLYLGGIGTYVRASSEPDPLIDDRANAEVRVSADTLRCRVVGEGANLGFTQQGRIEYARRGGRINMDAIDNSAGVDTSDREVNVKILLGLALDHGVIDRAERSALLADSVGDVVAAVLRDCADQSDALTRAVEASAEDLAPFEATQGDLVAAGVVDRGLEALPGGQEYEARRRAKAGLTRPELAVFLAGAKRRVKAAVLDSGLPDEPAARPALVDYFPPELARRFDPLLDHHRLRRELIASEIANDLVDHLGPTVTARLGAETGASPAEIAAAYWVARGVADGAVLWRLLAEHTGLPSGPADARVDALDPGRLVADLLESLARRELLEKGEPLDLEARIAEDGPVLAELRSVLLETDRPASQRARSARGERLVAGASTPPWPPSSRCCRSCTSPPTSPPWSRATGGRSAPSPSSSWISPIGSASTGCRPGSACSRRATRGLGLRARACSTTWPACAVATRRALEGAVAGDPAATVDRWLDQRAAPLREAAEIRRRVGGEDRITLDALAVAVRALRRAVR
ncbi:MAG: NAD-glutamate dehydrogenase domain-containing protein [Acidimicrobiales bacterium]